MSAYAPRPPAIPAPGLTDFLTVEKNGAHVQRLVFYNHTGTHLDTAAHVLVEGVSIAAFSPDDLIFTEIAVCEFNLPDGFHIGPEQLVPYEKKLAASDMAILRFGVDEIRKNEPERFSRDMPGFTPDAARWLRERCPLMRCLGIDLPSFAVISDLEHTMSAHNIFLEGNERKMLIIEEMKLDCIPAQGFKQIIISPWLYHGMDSGPCTVWGEVL